MIIRFLVDGLPALGKKQVARKCLCDSFKVLSLMVKKGREFTINSRRVIVLTPYSKWIKAQRETYEKINNTHKRNIKKWREKNQEHVKKQKRQYYLDNIEKEKARALKFYYDKKNGN